MLQRIIHGNVLELRLDRPPANALNEALFAALHAALVQAPGEGFGAIVISGRPGLFSGGLDVPELMGLDRDGLRRVWERFFDLLKALAAAPILSVAALTGHSPAGGAVLSLFCDYRVMAAGSYRIGLNETQVGLFVPEHIQYALRRLVGPHKAERMMVAGTMVESAEAFRIGLVDELAAPEAVIEQAIAWCKQHLSLPPLALQRTRTLARADLVRATTAPVNMESMLEGWFGSETQTVLAQLVAKLKKH